MLANRITLIYVLLMTAVVVASNVLVQYPLSGTLFGIALGDLLTYGAFTYPVAFLITDLTNRQFGPRIARRVVAAGFLVAVLFSIGASTPRIAIASGSAFLPDYWWESVLPGCAILFIALGFNLLGDGLRDLYDVENVR